MSLGAFCDIVAEPTPLFMPRVALYNNRVRESYAGGHRRGVGPQNFGQPFLETKAFVVRNLKTQRTKELLK